jgi:hypothetical protein
MSIQVCRHERSRGIPVRYRLVSLRDGKPGLADFVRYVAASTALRSAQNDRTIALL